MNKLVLSTLASSLLLSFAYADSKLEDVVVTAKSNTQAIDTAGSFSIITPEDIKSSNASSLQNILEETVGINVTSNDRSINGRKNITFRGMSPEHTAILINGKRISNTDAQIGHSDFQYSWIPLSAISKIEVVRGPMSSLYGSKALGGVINVITKKPTENFEGSLDLKYSRLNNTNQGQQKDISLIVSGQATDKLALSVFAQKQILDSVDNKDGVKSEKNVYNPSEFEGKDITNLMFNAWYSIDDTQEVSLSVLKGNEKRDAYAMDLFGTIQRGDIKNPVNSYFDKLYDIDKNHYSLEYSKFFNKASLNLKAYTTRSDIHSQAFRYTHKLKDNVGAIESTFENFDNHYIVLGADLRKEYYEKAIDSDGISSPFKNDITYKSVYFQDEIGINDKLLVTFGGRYDKHDEFGGEFSPKAYGVYKLDDIQRVKLGYGRGFNAPTLTQISDEYVFSNPSAGHAFMGNSKLNPEISNTFELSYEYNGENDLFKTTAFYTKVKDLISFAKTNKKAGTNYNTGKPIYYEIYSNINSSELKGIELEYTRMNIIENLDFNFFYTFLDTKDKENNRELNFKPKHKINSGVKYYFDDTLSTNLSVTYTGKQKNYDDRENTLTKMDGYVTSKFQLSKDFSKNLNMRIGIDNIGNKQLADEFNYQLRERTYYISLGYDF